MLFLAYLHKTHYYVRNEVFLEMAIVKGENKGIDFDSIKDSQ